MEWKKTFLGHHVPCITSKWGYVFVREFSRKHAFFHLLILTKTDFKDWKQIHKAWHTTIQNWFPHDWAGLIFTNVQSFFNRIIEARSAAIWVPKMENRKHFLELTQRNKNDLKFKLNKKIFCVKFPDFSFQCLQNDLTGKCSPIFQVFQSVWEPWILTNFWYRS